MRINLKKHSFIEYRIINCVKYQEAEKITNFVRTG